MDKNMRTRHLHALRRAALLPLLALPIGLSACGSDDNSPTITCGEGTVQIGTLCAPEDSLASCGPGTAKTDGSCLPEMTLDCGPGTMQIDGSCLPETIITCGPGTRLDGDTCKLADQEWVYLPFEAGEQVTVLQGFQNAFSHYGSSAYGVDFSVPEGTSVMAARGGVVIAVKEDSNQSCIEPQCESLSNFIIIDHGDGTFGHYGSLQQSGAEVDPGDVVCAGQRIGLTGSTGRTNTSQLHFSITNNRLMTLPVAFEELRERTSGVPFRLIRMTSENSPDAACLSAASTPPDDLDALLSSCGGDTMLDRGVLIDSPTRCAMVPRDEPIPLTGQVLTDTRALAVYRYSDTQNKWLFDCVRTDDQGRFSTTITWPSADHSGTHSWLHIAATPDECDRWESWALSAQIWFK